MGAFGRELERHFGGTIHDVRTWNNNKLKRLKTIEELLQETFIPEKRKQEEIG